MRLTTAQALVRFLAAQFVERDSVEHRFFGGCFGIFGHGNVAGIGEALYESPELLTYYHEAETKFGVPWYFLASINLIETRMGRIRGDSSAGAQGPMQFIPSTWAAYGEGDVNSYRDSILAAGRYLKAAGAPGDMGKALYAYNHDARYVSAVTGYGEVMRADPAAYRGYYGWQVYYPTADGPILMPPGWTKP